MSLSSVSIDYLHNILDQSLIQMKTLDIFNLRQGDRRTLSKFITLIDSQRDDHKQQAQQVLELILPYTGNSIRVGITGVPGVGKSTFIEKLGLYLIEKRKKVAVLTVDPTSPIKGGCILGDKVQMIDLSRNKHAYIRPSPSAGASGGVAQNTRECILLCEAAGYDVILIETIGVGQSEYDVASMVDFFLLMLLPGTSDELHSIKRGIVELADALIINKADGDNIKLAEQAKQHYQKSLEYFIKNDFWSPKVYTCSTQTKNKIIDTWSVVEEYHRSSIKNNIFHEKRNQQNCEWMNKLIHQMLLNKIDQNKNKCSQLPDLQQAVKNNNITPYMAAKKLVDLLN